MVRNASGNWCGYVNIPDSAIPEGVKRSTVHSWFYDGCLHLEMDMPQEEANKYKPDVEVTWKRDAVDDKDMTAYQGTPELCQQRYGDLVGVGFATTRMRDVNVNDWSREREDQWVNAAVYKGYPILQWVDAKYRDYDWTVKKARGLRECIKRAIPVIHQVMQKRKAECAAKKARKAEEEEGAEADDPASDSASSPSPEDVHSQ